MFFAGISLAEFLALFGLVSAATVALYLLSRARRRLTVSTLSFWQSAQESPRQTRRRRIDQPISLLLQLLAIACLLLAIAQPRIGNPEAQGRDHVLLLDTSAWMGARGARGPLGAQSIRVALEWMRALPPQDRVMVVRAGALPTPVTRFESSRKTLAEAIRGSSPSSGSLDLEQAFSLALQAQRLQARSAGEIVYAGYPRLPRAASAFTTPPNLRILPVEPPLDNIGLARVVLRRKEDDPERWDAFVTIRNYGAAPRIVPLLLAQGGNLVGSRSVTLPPRGESTSGFEFRSPVAGWFEARLGVKDSLSADDRVTIELPRLRRLRIDVCTANADVFRPLLAADKRLDARYLSPQSCAPAPDADLAVFDRSAPSSPWNKPALWIQPENGQSPFAGRVVESETAISGWRTGHPAAAGIHAVDLKLARAVIFAPSGSDQVLADSTRGPIAVLRDAEPVQAALGFHPLLSSMRFELTAPLLFANLIDWAAPDSFRRREVIAGAPGSIQVQMAQDTGAAPPRVIGEDGAPLPFTAEGRTLRFFSSEPSAVRVQQGGSERLFALSLPALGEEPWEAPGNVARGVPPSGPLPHVPRDLWRWLAFAGAALLALEWWLFARKLPAGTRSRKFSIALKGAAVAAALLALIAPALEIPETKMAVAVLADTSESVPPESLARASTLVAGIEGARGRNQLFVFPFARALRAPDPVEMASGWKLRPTAGEAGRSTDIETAIREASASLPSGLVPRIVLITDGRETRGSVARAAHQARLLGIPIDTFALAGRPQPKLKLLSVRFPAVAFTGERFPIDVTVESPSRASGFVELHAEGKSLGSSPVSLSVGENSFRVNASILTPGSIAVAGTLRADGLGDVRFEQAVNLRRPRMLYLSQDPPNTALNLLATFAAAQFEITQSDTLSGEKLDGYQMAVLNNWDLEGIAPAQKAALEKYVQRGGGLLVIGGEKNVYVEKKQPELDPLFRALPATIAPPRTPEGALVVLIIDKSSSMEGRKMELARLSAIGVIENLKPVDNVGVLIFDNSHQWAVPIRRAEDRTLIKRLIAGITPDGGTQIAPALAEAYRRTLPATGVYKHIVLLTDGISEEGDSVALAQEAANNRITISTVGLGQDVNRAYLEKIAAFAKGKSHFLTDPSGLEQILIRDVMEHTGSTTVEKPIQPRIVKEAEILSGLAMAAAPPLKGYVRFKNKPTADMILAVDKEDPLFTRWQYGLGRSAVFSSDAKSRWAAAWVDWPGFDRFWSNVVRDLLPHAQEGEAVLTHDAADGALSVEYRVAAHVAPPSRPPDVFVIGPEDFRAPVPLDKVAEGHFRGRVSIGNRSGLFRVRPLQESRAFIETGIYLPEPELAAYGNSPQLLRQLSEYTGGRFEPRTSEIFASTGRSITGRLEIWPGLLALAILLNLVEIAWRRLRGAAAAGAMFSFGPFRERAA